MIFQENIPAFTVIWMVLPHTFCRWPGVVQGVEVLFGAELAHLVHPVTRQCGWAHHQGGQGVTVCCLGPGIFLCPGTHTQV